MIRHIVLFKYKSETPAPRRQDFVRMLRALPRQIPGIQAAEVGEDVMHKERSFDVALIFTFGDRAALDAYTPHPAHQQVVEESHRINERVVSVDFEVR
ncbi:MAG: Dabb family protein [Acidobacteriia bacterium]|nr:Dabb family protein [Terriglobia bacterium]